MNLRTMSHRKEVLAGGHQRLGRRLDRLEVRTGQRGLQPLERRVDVLLLVALELVALVGQELLRLVDEGVGRVANLGLLTAPAVVLGCSGAEPGASVVQVQYS